MATRPNTALREAVARQILAQESDPAKLAVQLADEVLERGGWRANSCAPLLRAYAIARSQSASSKEVDHG